MSIMRKVTSAVAETAVNGSARAFPSTLVDGRTTDSEKRIVTRSRREPVRLAFPSHRHCFYVRPHEVAFFSAMRSFNEFTHNFYHQRRLKTCLFLKARYAESASDDLVSRLLPSFGRGAHTHRDELCHAGVKPKSRRKPH